MKIQIDKIPIGDPTITNHLPSNHKQAQTSQSIDTNSAKGVLCSRKKINGQLQTSRAQYTGKPQQQPQREEPFDSQAGES